MRALMSCRAAWPTGFRSVWTRRSWEMGCLARVWTRLASWWSTGWGVDDSRLLRVRLVVDSEDGALTLLADFRDYGAPLVIEAPEIPELNIPEPDAGGLDS